MVSVDLEMSLEELYAAAGISFSRAYIILFPLDPLIDAESKWIQREKRINVGPCEGNLSFGSSVSFSFIFNLQSED